MALPFDLVTRIGRAVNRYGHGRPVPAAELRGRLGDLDLEPNPDYADFAARWGGCFVGVPVHVWDNANVMGQETCIDLTLRARRNFGPLVDGLVFADDGSGNPLWLGPDHKVYLAQHDPGLGSAPIADSFAELLANTVHD